MNKKAGRFVSLILVLTMLLALAACGGRTSGTSTEASADPVTDAPTDPVTEAPTDPAAEVPTEPDVNDLTVVDSMEIQYATSFAVDYCANGCKILTDGSGRRILLVPEGQAIPEDTGDMLVFQSPITSLGCWATTHAVLFNAIGALDKVSMVTTAPASWHIPQMIEQLENGTTKFVGKAASPDYELISAVAPQAILVSANTLHAGDEVLTKMEELGIPWINDSMYAENHPLGRMEWVKFVGALLNMEDEANAYFDDAVARVNAVVDAVSGKAEHPSIVQTYIYKGVFYVRNGASYVNKMLELAGGTYTFADLEPESSENTKMSLEDFFAAAADLDILIYDNTSDTSVSSIADILEKGDFLGDIKAIREGNVWGVEKNYWQAADDVATMIEDLANIIYFPEKADELHYFYRLPATSAE